MKKKGISTIVATVLIVLITVAAVTILWAAISPLVGDNLAQSTSCLDVQSSVKIDADKTYTCLNASSGEVNVRFVRAANTDTLEGFEVFLEDSGNTVAAGSAGLTFDLTNLQENGAYVYTLTDGASGNFDTSGAGLTAGQVKVSVAPRVLIDGEQTSCTVSQPVELRSC